MDTEKENLHELFASFGQVTNGMISLSHKVRFARSIFILFDINNNIITLRELIFAGTNFRGRFFWTFRGN